MHRFHAPPLNFSLDRHVSLSDVDRSLLQRCLDQEPNAWRDFADRFIGLVVHVVQRTAADRGSRIDESTCEDLVSEVFLVVLRRDAAVLRQFRRQCSLATYLTVVARRVVVRRLIELDRQLPGGASQTRAAAPAAPSSQPADRQRSIERIDDRDHVEQLLLRLDDREARVVRLYHLEGKSYGEIGRLIGVNENSIGPMLHRARAKMNGHSKNEG